MGKKNYSEIVKLGKALDNPNRREIMDIVEENQPINISQISKKVKLAYKNVLNHLKVLEEAGFLETEKQEKSHGREVLVKYVGEDNPSTMKEITKEFFKALRHPSKPKKEFERDIKEIEKHNGTTIDEIAIKTGLKPSRVWFCYSLMKDIDTTKTKVVIKGTRKRFL